MIEINPSKPILVTGGSGYIASWIVKYLLEKGYKVRTTVRSLKDKSKITHLLDLEKQYPDNLAFFEADLMKKGSFKDSIDGCELVIHTASPFVISGIKDAQKELIEPALEGTRNVLLSANEVSSVKRIVLTSSVVSIHGDSIDIKKVPNGIFTEKEWNTSSSLTKSPYGYSKTLAEKEAWKICEAQNNWDLVTINPGFVFGPSLSKRKDSTSIDFMLSMANGKFKTGVAGLFFGVVDVRDVAIAHINAGFLPKAKRRHILVADTLSMIDIAKILRDKYGNKYPFPKSVVPKFLMYFVGPFLGFNWQYVSDNIGIEIKYDNSFSKENLDINYRSLKDTITEHFDQIIKDGLL